VDDRTKALLSKVLEEFEVIKQFIEAEKKKNTVGRKMINILIWKLIPSSLIAYILILIPNYEEMIREYTLSGVKNLQAVIVYICEAIIYVHDIVIGHIANQAILIALFISILSICVFVLVDIKKYLDKFIKACEDIL